MEDTLHYPAPWHLKGEGFIIPFLGNKKILLEKSFIAEEDRASFTGGLGAIMLVNYESSNVGPYFELLFIPGDFKYSQSVNGKIKTNYYKKITKIFVSSKMSIQEGRLNWAIPKELANFTWDKKGNSTTVNVISPDGKNFLEAEFTKKFIPFPVTTKVYPVSLLQKSDDGKLINTQFSGSGKGKFASINRLITNHDFFPNVREIAKFSLGLSVEAFNIIFPVPKFI